MRLPSNFEAERKEPPFPLGQISFHACLTIKIFLYKASFDHSKNPTYKYYKIFCHILYDLSYSMPKSILLSTNNLLASTKYPNAIGSIFLMNIIELNGTGKDFTLRYNFPSSILVNG